MDEALRILAAYEELGIKELWLTPHIMEDIPNTPDRLKARFAELKEAYTGNIVLHLAAEYMIDNNLRKLLDTEIDKDCPSFGRGTSSTCDAEGDSPLLPIGNNGKHLLVETSYYNPPIKFHETLKQIKSMGYYPLLAHPERYMYMDEAEYRRLREEGVKFQLNLASLAGGYGKIVKKKALWLLEKGFYDVAGSDLHCEDTIDYLVKSKIKKNCILNIAKTLKNGI